MLICGASQARETPQEIRPEYGTRATRPSATVNAEKWCVNYVNLRSSRRSVPHGSISPASRTRYGMPKARTVYFCSACGFESPRWLGRCPQCEAWNSFDERPMRVVAARTPASAARSAGGPAPLDDVRSEEHTSELQSR